MRHPLPSLPLRLAAAAMASLALVFASAASASANTPMKIVADTGSVLSVFDDESWPDKSWMTSWSLSGTTFGTLYAGSTNFSYNLARCAGGEVRAELKVDAYRWSYTDTAEVTAYMNLYEGTSCTTSDLDGQSGFYHFSLKPGETKKLTINAENQKESSDDFAAATITFRALPL